jgi:hypothetical protein
VKGFRAPRHGEHMKRTSKGRTLRRVTGSCAIAAAVLSAGCDNNHRLGAIDSGVMPAEDAGAQGGTDASPDLTRPVIKPLQPWTGYIENYHLPSGSDVVKLGVILDTSPDVSGNVALGSGTPPPPAADPNVGYPADYTVRLPGLDATPYVAEGYSYPIHAGGMRTGQRLQFFIDLTDLWSGWCGLQTPPADGSPICVPGNGGMVSADRMSCAYSDSATGQLHPIDCGKYSLCAFDMVCFCGVGQPTCTTSAGHGDVMFDITIGDDSATASGSIAGVLGDHNIHLTPDP